jgi:hypothetical protein
MRRNRRRNRPPKSTNGRPNLVPIRLPRRQVYGLILFIAGLIFIAMSVFMFMNVYYWGSGVFGTNTWVAVGGFALFGFLLCVTARLFL